MPTQLKSRPTAQSATRTKTVCVVGSDEDNLDLIRRLPGAETWKVVPVLAWSDVQPAHARIDFEELYAKAHKIIDAQAEPPDAIIGYLDFPVTSLVALLQRDYGLPGASPEAVAKCEHKYWMRLYQKRVFPKETPKFKAINPFARDEARKQVPPYPFWLKPVKGHSSVLGFMVERPSQLSEALHACRQKIHLFGEPFNHFLKHVGDRHEIKGVDGNFAIVESIISARHQFTLEGYVWKGKTTVYGAVDSLRQGHYGTSLSCYRYPAKLPEAVVERATGIAAKVLDAIGYDNAPFNVEFFWDPDSDALNLLEINPRISKSHSPLFAMVDGASHHKVAIDLALGRKPEMPHRKGKDAVAGKFMLRSFEADGVVKRVPHADEIADLVRILPDIDVNVLVSAGQKLSDLAYQDSYSYELADVFLGGEDEEMLIDAYARCLDSLNIYIKPLPPTS